MHIVVYSKPFFPQMGGLERNTLTLCLALHDLGHQVHLVTESSAEGPDKYPFPVTRTCSVTAFFRELSNADLLIVNGNVSLRMHPLAWIRGVPYATIYATFVGHKRQGRHVRTQVENQLREAVANRSVANIFLSRHAKEQSGLPESTAYVVLNPVDKWMQRFYTEARRQNKRQKSPYLFAGRIIEGKGIFVLADALEFLDGDVDLRVLVAGEGRDEGRFRERTRHLSTIQVNFAGRLDSPDLVEVYQNSRALIVPSTTHKEGNPLVIAEAIYAGTPVIASNQPPMIESVGDAGIIVEQRSAQGLAEAIRIMESNTEAYRNFQRNARERADLFTYERYRGQVREIFGTGRQSRCPREGDACARLPQTVA